MSDGAPPGLGVAARRAAVRGVAVGAVVGVLCLALFLAIDGQRRLAAAAVALAIGAALGFTGTFPLGLIEHAAAGYAAPGNGGSILLIALAGVVFAALAPALLGLGDALEARLETRLRGDG